MMKTLHDKVYTNNFKSIKYKCDSALNTLAIKSDYNHLVVGGRAVFKVLSIKEDSFSEVLNLRAGKSKSINLSYSAADVAWHPSQENILASAALNGFVVIWDINSNAKSRQTMTFSEHKRAVNRVIFNHSKPNHLLSASQDGMVMIHDIRSQSVSARFGRPGGDSVRDAQFSPFGIGEYVFAAAYDNNVQIWDTRNPNKCERLFTAHSGPVFTLDWHPTDKKYLATGGRDKMIKVWDITPEQGSYPICENTIMNFGPVTRIKWRPQRKHHISSCCSQFDNNVNIWDLGRPYIPFASFEGHTDATSCIAWREDCHTFLTCGKDSAVIQHVFADAKRPADKVNLACIDFSVEGDLGFVYSDKNESLGKQKKAYSQSRQQFSVTSSSFYLFQSCDDTVLPEIKTDDHPLSAIPSTWRRRFVALAQNYHLDGASLIDICYHNGQMAEKFDRPEVAQSWRILAAFYSPSFLSTSGTAGHHISQPSTLSLPPSHQDWKKDSKEKASKPATKRLKDKKKRGLTNMEPTSGSNEESSEVEGENSEVEKGVTKEFNLNTSILFGEGEMDDSSYEWQNAAGTLEDNTDDLNMGNIPEEGFCKRHELNPGTAFLNMNDSGPDCGLKPLLDAQMSSRFTKARSGCDIERRVPSELLKENSEPCEPTLIIKDLESPEPMDFSRIVAEMIKCYAEEGDVQTVVTMLIVLGDYIHSHLDEAFQESWCFAYIDLLSQFRQWTVANSIIKQSKLIGVNILNQESTVFHTRCARCKRSLERVSWLCDKCKNITNLCSICHTPVKGLMAWCQGCSHGGHVHHIQEWLAFSKQCPAGCGHLCEYK